MTATKLATVDQVAKLYEVDRTTVWRWHHNDLFSAPRQSLPSPSGQRDRILFDVTAIVHQYRREMILGLEPGQILDYRNQKLKEFQD